MDLITLKNIGLNKGINTEDLRKSGISLRDEEFESISKLVDKLLSLEGVEIDKFIKKSNGFECGYEIPQIGKEFDLLRFGNNYNLNIEIKNGSTMEKQMSQIHRNEYYLKAINNNFEIISVDTGTNTCLASSIKNGNINSIIEVDFLYIYKMIINQDIIQMSNLDEIFHPKYYLVNPFNNTKKFLKEEYMLTSHQEEILKTYHKSYCIAVEGGPGTGKSLLLYSIVQDLINNCNKTKEDILIIHCGTLNSGHRKLQENGFNIVESRFFKAGKISESTKYIFIDEAQRIFPNQMENVMNQAEEKNILLNFFFDPFQTFFENSEGEEAKAKFFEYIEEHDGRKYKLSKNIRTNQDLSVFIDQVMEYRPKQIKVIDNSDEKIKLVYTADHEQTKAICKAYGYKRYKILSYTPSQYDYDLFDDYKISENIPQYTIGQEFDKTVVIIPEFFYYERNQEGKMEIKSPTRGSYYSGPKMLFQNITRATTEIVFVIENNEEVFNSLIKFLSR